MKLVKHLGGLFNSGGQRRFAGRRQSVNYAHNSSPAAFGIGAKLSWTLHWL